MVSLLKISANADRKTASKMRYDADVINGIPFRLKGVQRDATVGVCEVFAFIRNRVMKHIGGIWPACETGFPTEYRLRGIWDTFFLWSLRERSERCPSKILNDDLASVRLSISAQKWLP